MTTAEIFDLRDKLIAEASSLFRAMSAKAGDMANAGKTVEQIDAVNAVKMARYNAINSELRTLRPF